MYIRMRCLRLGAGWRSSYAADPPELARACARKHGEIGAFIPIATLSPSRSERLNANNIGLDGARQYRLRGAQTSDQRPPPPASRLHRPLSERGGGGRCIATLLLPCAARVRRLSEPPAPPEASALLIAAVPILNYDKRM